MSIQSIALIYLLVCTITSYTIMWPDGQTTKILESIEESVYSDYNHLATYHTVLQWVILLHFKPNRKEVVCIQPVGRWILMTRCLGTWSSIAMVLTTHTLCFHLFVGRPLPNGINSYSMYGYNVSCKTSYCTVLLLNRLSTISRWVHFFV